MIWYQCSLINSGIIQIASSEISFAYTSIQKPHVTLSMGYCENLSDFFSVIREVAFIVTNIKPANCFVGKPYIKSPDNNYIFADVEPFSTILPIKKLLWESLSRYLRPLDWDVVQEKAHITLAYIADNKEKVSQYLENISPLGETLFKDVSVSFAGKRGTCLGTIKTFHYYTGLRLDSLSEK
jgi:hypothetical protein